MDKQEAALLFKGDSIDEVELEFEDRFFRLKQELRQKPPLRKIWNSKVMQFKRLLLAYSVLAETEVDSFESLPLEKPEFENDVEATFNTYQLFRSQLLHSGFATTNPLTFISIVHTYLDISDEYMKYWSRDDVEDGEVLISKEPDPMDLIEGIRDFKKSGLQTFEDLNALPKGHVLILESKRLTLLLKNNQDA